MPHRAHSGDGGETSLGNGARVPKDDVRIEACGTIDELNAVLGMLAALLRGPHEALAVEIVAIQRDILDLGASLAGAPGAPCATGVARIAHLEQSMHRMRERLPSLHGFIVPGGTACAAWAHIARATCRRAERRAVTAASHGGGSTDARGHLAAPLAYLNRLSEYLFTLARSVNHAAGIHDDPWTSADPPADRPTASQG